MHSVCTLGTVFDIQEKTVKSKRGHLSIIKVGLTDKDSSIYIQISTSADKRDEEMSYFNMGDSYAVKCNVKIDEFNKDKETYISYTDILKISKKETESIKKNYYWDPVIRNEEDYSVDVD